MLSLPTEIRGEEDRSFDAQDGERQGYSRESSASIVLGRLERIRFGIWDLSSELE